MFGNPYPGGRCAPVTCSPSVPCLQHGHICRDGTCVQACGVSSCGLNARCAPGGKHCACAEGFVGDPSLVCMPPTGPPKCSPGCGANAHCQYYNDGGNTCACNDGFQGNPYTGCTKPTAPLTEVSCAEVRCGSNAVCSLASGRAECVCAKGYEGVGYQGCRDVDECQLGAAACGENAQCINTPGAYDCRCKFGYRGNPFTACIVYHHVI